MTEVRHVQVEVPGFRGQLLREGDAGYDEARQVFNGMIDRRPAVIARCQDTADVANAVKAARANQLPLSVYGGGHGVTGAAVVDGGVCVDLRGLASVDVEAEQQILRVGAGATWGTVDAATQEHGLAVPGGRVSTTGVGGLSLGSGSSWLERKLGFACDSLLEAEVVTADGHIVTASASQNPDLFWGLRGGGGNFGIVTKFTFRLHPVGPMVLGGMLMYPTAMAREVLRFWRDFILQAPDEVGGAVAFITAPPADFVPEPVRGHPVLGIIVTYAGDPEVGQKVVAPLLEFGPPAVSMVAPMPYVALQQMLDEGNQKGKRNYWTADFMAELPGPAVDTLVDLSARAPSPLTQVVIFPGGGAVARVPDDETAFGERDAPFNVHYLTMWEDPADDERNIAYTREISTAMKPWTTGRLYLNMIGDEGPERVRAAYGPAKWARLRALKKTWDPDNVFRHNQNIPPAD
ncbi:MAG TPA: FAD-binding oxidoreductase [Actinomycetes bacterium]